MKGSGVVPKFNINKMRSAGLRYLVADSDGQVWAFELMPERADGHWALNAKHLCPNYYGDAYKSHWAKVLSWKLKGREFCMPVFDSPIELSFSDEPFDIVRHGLVPESEMKKWPEL